MTVVYKFETYNGLFFAYLTPSFEPKSLKIAHFLSNMSPYLLIRPYEAVLGTCNTEER